jgi:hypothetical protein
MPVLLEEAINDPAIIAAARRRQRLVRSSGGFRAESEGNSGIFMLAVAIDEQLADPLNAGDGRGGGVTLPPVFIQACLESGGSDRL